jgi:VanZ family protein
LPIDPAFERAGAYFLLGFFVWLGYRPRWTTMILLVLLTAIGLEAAQLLTRDRHAELVDGFVKFVGGLVGVGAGFLLAGQQDDQTR